MARLQLSGGAYQARSVIAAAQSCINLIAEPMPQIEGEPASWAYYPTPGLTLLGTAPGVPFRGAITCSTGQTFVVSGNHVYLLGEATPGNIAAGVVFIDMGTIAPGITTPVGMAENSAALHIGSTGTLVICDGTATGYQVALGSTPTMSPIADPNFLGATNFDYVDTFFVSNVPGTAQFQAGNSLSVAWNPLYVAAKVSHSDLLSTLIVAKREIWLLGQTTSEVWYNTGAADFPFEEMQGVFIDHGIVARYSAAELDNAVYWLSQDRRGQNIVIEGSGYQTKRISTYALEAEMRGYGQVGDAEGYTFQQSGHQFYMLSFPAQDKTWAYDISTQQWHRWAWMDGGGVLHRHRARQVFPAFINTQANILLAGDWQNGNIYLVDPTVFTDNGLPILRQRAFPHLLNDGNRRFYWQFIADIETGMAPGGATLNLDWSDDRGHTFGTPVGQSMGAAGAYLTSMQWQRLGMARDRVFRLTWTGPVPTALQGCWVETEDSEG